MANILSSHAARPRARRRYWTVPAGLLALAALPTLFGIVRLLGFVTGRATLPDHARVAEHAWPLVLHIVGATGFAILGAFQFHAPLQRRRWHRVAGRCAVLLGIVGALTAMWLATMVPPSADDASWLRGPRFAAGASTLACLLAGFVVAARDVAAHRAWMTRAYAIALGSGTQFFTVAPYMMLAERRSETVSSVLLVAGWVINLAVAERALRSRKPSGASTSLEGDRR